MINSMDLIVTNKERETLVDSILCPHCYSEMLRSSIDNPYNLDARTYVCYNCGAEKTINSYDNIRKV